MLCFRTWVHVTTAPAYKIFFFSSSPASTKISAETFSWNLLALFILIRLVAWSRALTRTLLMYAKQMFSAEVKNLSVSCGVAAAEIGYQHHKEERGKSVHDQENILAIFRDVLKIINSDGF